MPPASIEWEQIATSDGSTIRLSEDVFMNFGSVARHLFSLEMGIGV